VMIDYNTSSSMAPILTPLGEIMAVVSGREGSSRDNLIDYHNQSKEVQLRFGSWRTNHEVNP